MAINKGLLKVSAAKLAKANQLNQIISDYRHLFTPGSEFTVQDLRDMMGITLKPKPTTCYKTLQRRNLEYMSFYLTLNRVLRHRGLVIESSDYYTKYRVLALPEQIKGKVQSYQSHSSALQGAAKGLAEGYAKHRGKWRKLGPNQLKRVAHTL